MRVFYDFEFFENGETIKPISLGMIRDDGKEYYAVFSDSGAITDALKSTNPWVRKNVLPYLPITVQDDGSFQWDENHADFKNIRTKRQVAGEILRFLDVTNLSLWGWYTDYDHVVLAQIWGMMIDLPMGIPQRTNDLAQEVERLGNPIMPEQPYGNHNALEDARFNMFRAVWLDNVTNVVTHPLT